MEYQDLRGWLEELDKIGELKKVEGAHWDKEIGAISELMAEKNGPALLFDKIPDYPDGFRVLSNCFQSDIRTASVLGAPLAVPWSMHRDPAERWRSVSRDR